MKDSIYLYNEEENKLLSRTISFIRFPLCVLVVILHSDLLAKPIYRLGILDIEQNCTNYTSYILVFFSLFSVFGCSYFFYYQWLFYFFYNIKEFTLSVYKNSLLLESNRYLFLICVGVYYTSFIYINRACNIVLRDESNSSIMIFLGSHLCMKFLLNQLMAHYGLLEI